MTGLLEIFHKEYLYDSFIQYYVLKQIPAKNRNLLFCESNHGLLANCSFYQYVL